MNYAKTLIATGSSVVIAALLSSPVYAAGVPAGTRIENTATASFDVGGAPASVDSNTVEVLVDELLDVATASQDGNAIPITSDAVLTYTVTNTGNGPEDFFLTADPSVPGNDFDVTVNAIAIDTDGDGVYDPNVDTILTGPERTAILQPDAPYTVFVLVTAPNTATDGQTSAVNLTARAVTGSGTPGTVIAGAGEGGGDAVVGATTAIDDAVGPLIASRATVSLVKSATVSNVYNTSEAIPGAVITYQIVATVSGSSSVSNLNVSDTIPTNTQYRPGSLTLDTVALTDADDSDAGAGSPSGVTVTVPTANGGTSYTVTFDVTID